jgi:hypothetical protein
MCFPVDFQKCWFYEKTLFCLSLNPNSWEDNDMFFCSSPLSKIGTLIIHAAFARTAKTRMKAVYGAGASSQNYQNLLCGSSFQLWGCGYINLAAFPSAYFSYITPTFAKEIKKVTTFTLCSLLRTPELLFPRENVHPFETIPKISTRHPHVCRLESTSKKSVTMVNVPFFSSSGMEMRFFIWRWICFSKRVDMLVQLLVRGLGT